MAEGDLRKSDGDIYYASEYNKQPFKIASGTITLAIDQTAYDNDYADISIAAGDLTVNDFLIIETAAKNDSAGDSVRMQIETKDVTSPGNIIGDAATGINPSRHWHDRIVIAQHPTTNTTLRGHKFTDFTQSTSSIQTMGGDAATGDTNVITTAFTIRINLKYDGTSGNEASSLRYIAYVVRG